MKKFLFCVTLLLSFLPSPSRSEGMLTFGSNVRLTYQELQEVERFLVGGWNAFRIVSRTSSSAPIMRYVPMAEADIAIIKGNYPQVAEVKWHAPDKRSYIYVSYDRIIQYDLLSRDHLLAHEYCHFYFSLPDHYHSNEVHHPECIMDNFHVYGWTGKLCVPCQSLVHRYYVSN